MRSRAYRGDNAGAGWQWITRIAALVMLGLADSLVW